MAGMDRITVTSTVLLYLDRLNLSFEASSDVLVSKKNLPEKAVGVKFDVLSVLYSLFLI